MTAASLLACWLALAVFEPSPDAIERLRGGPFRIGPNTPVILANNARPHEVARVRAALEEAGFDLPVRPASSVRAGDHGIYVGEPERHASLDTRRMRLHYGRAEPPGPHGFRIAVSRDVAVIAGDCAAGSHYGLQTFLGLVEPDRTVPQLRLTDGPETPLRAAVAEAPLDSAALRELADARFSMIIYSHPELLLLQGAAADRWEAAFAKARQYGLEPVPVLAPAGGAQALTAARPETAPLRVREERIPLDGGEWTALAEERIFHTDARPIEAWRGGQRLELERDYTLDRLHPASDASLPERWLIQGGSAAAMEGGAQTRLRYHYAPEGAPALCPTAEGAEALLRRAVAQAVHLLAPEHIHLGAPDPAVNAGCVRCADAGLPGAAALERLFATVTEAAQDANGGEAPGFMAWTDGLAPTPGGPEPAATPAVLPQDALLIARHQQYLPGRSNLDWAAASGLPHGALATGGRVSVYESLRHGAAQGDAFAGIAVPVPANPDPELVSTAGRLAWRMDGPQRAWPGGLNRYFGADLWDPGYETVLAVMSDHLNRGTLQGMSPGSRSQAFEEATARLPRGADGLDMARTLYGNLLEYLTIEAGDAEERGSQASSMLALVAAQHGFDPRAEQARTEAIRATVQRTGLVVPSTILFGPHLLPYRAMDIPTGHALMEIPATPEFRESEDVAEAVFSLPALPGPVYRVDFETIATAELIVRERRQDGAARTLAEITSQERGGVQGPVLLRPMATGTELSVSAHAPVETAVLRHPRLFGLKAPAVGVGPRVAEAPSLDARPGEAPWPAAPQAEGFVAAGEGRFAEAQSEVWTLRTDTELHIHAILHEPRMDTMAASHTERDAPLWEEEAFEIRFIRGGQPGAYRFLVNPLGAQYDSHAGVTGWNTDWTVETETRADAWEARLVIPFAALDGDPGPDATWRVNFIRHRRNVQDETSSWTFLPNGTGAPEAYGRIVLQ